MAPSSYNKMFKNNKKKLKEMQEDSPTQYKGQYSSDKGKTVTFQDDESDSDKSGKWDKPPKSIFKS